jgi:hypothetical protein
MPRRLLLAGVLVITLVTAWDAPPAAACSCMSVSDEVALEQADAAFTGEVLSAPTPPVSTPWSSTDPGVWTFAVDRVYKGTVAPQQEVVSAISGASCGLELPTQGPVLVFTRTAPQAFEEAVEGATLYADLCGGSRSLHERPVPATFAATSPTEPNADPGATPPVDGNAAGAVDDREIDRLAIPLLAVGVGAIVAVLWTARRRSRRPSGPVEP